MSALHMEIGGDRIRFLRSLMSGMTLLTGTGPGTHNPIKPEFIIVIFIHHKPRFTTAILDL